MIVARDFMKIATDAGRIGSPATEGRDASGRKRRPLARSAGEDGVLGGMDAAVVGEPDLKPSSGRPFGRPER